VSEPEAAPGSAPRAAVVNARPSPGAATPSEEEQERRTAPVELLWDLVFVFALTQVTTLLSGALTWAGFGRAVLILALVWWAWSAFVWAANAQTATSPALSWVLIAATGVIFVAGLAVPHAFSSEGTLFACAYAAVRLLHLMLYAHASRAGRASWRAIAGFAGTVVFGMALLIAGSFLALGARVGLWIAAVAIDYAGPAWLTRERLRGLQRVAVAHFAERYGLFVIICLGESIVSVGAGALGTGAGPERALSASRVAAVALLLAITVEMWWAYFDRSAPAAERRLREHADPVLAAADGYSYLHLPIVAGIVVFAVGAKLLVRGAVTMALFGPARLALCGGVALYLLAHVAFCLRLGERRGRWRSAAAIGLIGLYALGGGLAGWTVAAGVCAVLGATFAIEALEDRAAASVEPAPAPEATTPPPP
jgi:low temperature requirement protein LtrA